MKEREIFEKLRTQTSRMSLSIRFVITVAIIVLVSGIISLLVSMLAEWLYPPLKNFPYSIQVILLIFVFSLSLSCILASRFFRPIKILRKGMEKVSDGDFDVTLESRSSAKEFQELIAGFNMMVRELRSTEILQSDFVSNVSHEFKTPINAIEGYATLLQNTDNIDETENEYIEKILFNTRRLSSLVSNVLLLSKIENQSLSLHKATYDIGEQIREEIVALESSWSEKEIEFDVDIDDTDYCGYENLLHHIWSNLLSNAIKFSPHGGEIKISLKKSDQKIIFYVEDQGEGISEDAKKHIFDKFYQGDTSHKSEGNGLGLALVKRILTVCNGDIFAENIENGGCRFTVNLSAFEPQI